MSLTIQCVLLIIICVLIMVAIQLHESIKFLDMEMDYQQKNFSMYDSLCSEYRSYLNKLLIEMEQHKDNHSIFQSYLEKFNILSLYIEVLQLTCDAMFILYEHTDKKIGRYLYFTNFEKELVEQYEIFQNIFSSIRNEINSNPILKEVV